MSHHDQSQSIPLPLLELIEIFSENNLMVHFLHTKKVYIFKFKIIGVDDLKDKQNILKEIKKPYRTTLFGKIFLTLFIGFFILIFLKTVIVFILHPKHVSLDFNTYSEVSWTFIFFSGLYHEIWKFTSSRRINQVLFPQIEQLISHSEGQSYEETEFEAMEMVKVAYSDYSDKYQKRRKILTTVFTILFVLPFIYLFFEFIFINLINIRVN